MRYLICSLALVGLAACGGSPTGPSPQPSPNPSPAPSFTVTDTVTGAPVSGFTATVTGSRVLLAAPGYLSRDTPTKQAIDLIPSGAPFNVEFYRQFVRNGLTAPGTPEPLRRLTIPPSMYLQTTGLSASQIASLEQAARVSIFEMSGHTLGMAAFETGPDLRPDRGGWITVQIVTDPSAKCGNALIGAPAGHITLSLASGCSPDRFLTVAMAHEVGHAMGFWHVADPAAMMFANATTAEPSAAERYHAAIAYKRPVGNRDLDVDP